MTDNFSTGLPKVGGRGYFLETSFWRAGRYYFFGKGRRATRASTLSPDLVSFNLAALFSGKKIPLRQGLKLETALMAPLFGKWRGGIL